MTGQYTAWLEVWLLISSVAIGFDVPTKSAAGIVRLRMNYGILTGYGDKNSGLPFALVPFLSPILILHWSIRWALNTRNFLAAMVRFPINQPDLQCEALQTYCGTPYLWAC